MKCYQGQNRHFSKQVELTYTVGGGTKAILKSPLMLRVQDSVPYVEFPKNISVDFYNEQQH